MNAHTYARAMSHIHILTLFTYHDNLGMMQQQTKLTN